MDAASRRKHFLLRVCTHSPNKPPLSNVANNSVGDRHRSGDASFGNAAVNWGEEGPPSGRPAGRGVVQGRNHVPGPGGERAGVRSPEGTRSSPQPDGEGRFEGEREKEDQAPHFRAFAQPLCVRGNVS